MSENTRYPEPSPAFQLVALVYSNAKRRTWRDLNESLTAALSLAIGIGLRFDKDDFGKMQAQLKGDHWMGIGGTREWIYDRAIDAENTSAAIAYEHWIDRRPFFLNGTRLHMRADISKRLLDLGTDADRVTEARVTSFSEDGQSITICAYNYQDRATPIRRFTFTHAELRKLPKTAWTE